MQLVLITALIVVALLLALYANGTAYVAHARKRWPVLGRFIESKGAKIHIVERGPADAPRLLLLHGANGNLREMLGPFSALEADHRVIAMDRPGAGYSTARKGHEITTQARLAAAVLEATGGAAIIVAHSLGGAVALRLAHDRPDLVRGMVLIAPFAQPYEFTHAWWARLAATPLLGPIFASTFVPLVGPVLGHKSIANIFWPARPTKDFYNEAGIGLAFCPTAFVGNARAIIATQKAFAAQAPLYPEILAPTVIVVADKDRVISPKRHAQALAAQLPAVELVTAPGAGHVPHRVRNDLVIAAIRRVETMAALSSPS